MKKTHLRGEAAIGCSFGAAARHGSGDGGKGRLSQKVGTPGQQKYQPANRNGIDSP